MGETTITICTAAGTVHEICNVYVGDMVYGWYFEQGARACTFTSPLPSWVFAINDTLTSLLLAFLC